MVELLPYVGVGAVAAGLFSLHASVLYMYRQAWRVAAFNAAWVGILFTAAFILVRQMGFIGYGWAELISLPTYFVLHLIVSKALGVAPKLMVPLMWTVAMGLLMFFQQLGWWSLLGMTAVLLWPASWREITMHISQTRDLLNRPRSHPESEPENAADATQPVSAKARFKHH